MLLTTFPRALLALAAGAAILCPPARAASLLDGAGPMVELYATAEASSVGGFDVAALPDGRFALVWAEEDTPNDHYSIKLARFETDGTALGAPIEVVTTSSTSAIPNHPIMAADLDGNLVVAWEEDSGSIGSCDTFAYSLVDNDGTVAGRETISYGNESAANCFMKVAMSNDGRFVIGWFHQPTTNPPVLVVSTFNADGSVIAPPFQLAVPDPVYCEMALTMQGDTFTAAWTAEIGEHFPILARRYNQNGTALGEEFRLDNGSPYRGYLLQTTPSLAPDQNGGFVGLWYQEESVGDERIQTQLGRRWAADGTAGTALTLSNDDASPIGPYYNAPSPATDGAGLIVAAWAATLDGVGTSSRLTAFQGNQRLGDEAVTLWSYTEGYFYPPYTEVVLNDRTAITVWRENNTEGESTFRARSLTLPEAPDTPDRDASSNGGVDESSGSGGGGGGASGLLTLLGLGLLARRRRASSRRLPPQ